MVSDGAKWKTTQAVKQQEELAKQQARNPTSSKKAVFRIRIRMDPHYS